MSGCELLTGQHSSGLGDPHKGALGQTPTVLLHTHTRAHTHTFVSPCVCPQKTPEGSGKRRASGGSALSSQTALSQTSAVSASLGPGVFVPERAREVRQVVNQSGSPSPDLCRRLEGKLPVAVWKNLTSSRQQGEGENKVSRAQSHSPAAS